MTTRSREPGDRMLILRVFRFLAVLGCFAYTLQAFNDPKVGSIVLDDEIEMILTHWVSEIFKVDPHLSKSVRPRLYLVADPEINAAASMGGQIFVHSGLIARCQNVEELLGVLAHEVGHISGGHIARMDQASQGAAIPAAAAVILGGALAIASGNPEAAMAGLSGAAHIFNRGMMKFSREQESSADQAALEYLDRLGWGSRGLLDFFRMIHDKSSAYISKMNPYDMTHPLTDERIRVVENHLKISPAASGITPKMRRDFERIKAKVIGFLEPTKEALNLTAQASRGLSAEGIQLAQAAAYFRVGKHARALELVEALLSQNPDDPFFLELKGQVILDQGRNPKAAVAALKRAHAQYPMAKGVGILLAQAYIAAQLPQKAVALLRPALQRDRENAMGWYLLGRAYADLGQNNQAHYAQAEFALHTGDILRARTLANTLKRDPMMALRAQDLLLEIEELAKNLRS